MDATIVCPRCLGQKETVGIACGGKRSGQFIALPCHTCSGAGVISGGQALWIESGKALREQRIERGFTLRSGARALKVGAVELSDAEQGRVDPAPMRARMEQWLSL